jgi:ubiquinone/menaquinone biosynthesis C-methylase UbiE
LKEKLMSWFGFWRRKSASSAQAARPSRLIGGRRFAAGVPYLLPSDLGETNRLDFQHYMLRSALKGNYAAPLSRPQDILDVGSGTGRWAIEMATQFPDANVVGVDVAPPAADANAATDIRPENYAFVQGNVLERLPFADNSFDFVHQRLLVAAIPAARWPSVVAELLRVTRPGGWVELLEAESRLPNAGPGLQTSIRWMTSLAGRRGIDPASASQIGGFLQQAGAQHIASRMIALPVGERAGRLGAMAKADLMAGMNGLRGVVTSMGLISEPDFESNSRQIEAELSSGRISWPFFIAFGQKPR